MQKYRVLVTRNITESATVEVFAASREEAAAAAVAKARVDDTTDWEEDEGNVPEVYVSDPDDGVLEVWHCQSCSHTGDELDFYGTDAGMQACPNCGLSTTIFPVTE